MAGKTSPAKLAAIKRWQEANKERVKEYRQRPEVKAARLAAVKRWQERNKEKVKAYRKASREKCGTTARRWIENNPVKWLWHKAKMSAKRRDLEFSLAIEDITIPTHCAYLGVELTHVQGKGLVDSNYSIDRIDNNKGYIKGNVEIVSALANRMKQNATPEQLVAFAHGVLRKHANEATQVQ